TVLVWQLVHEFGVETLGAIVLLAGLLQVAAGTLRLGQWFRAVSPAVVHGMLGGIGVLIVASQAHVMLDGKPLGTGVDNLLGLPAVLREALAGSPGLQALGVGALAIAVMVAWPLLARGRLKLVPAPLLAVAVGTLAAAAFGLDVHRISLPPDLLQAVHVPSLATLASALGNPHVLLAAASVAFIASAETLLSVTALDAMHQGPRARYNRELVAQGVGNGLCGLLGALPMTGVVVRSSANVQAGARSRLSAMLHGAWLLAAIALLPFVLAHVPVAALAAVLVYTGAKLAWPKAIAELARFGRGEVAIYVATVAMIVCTNLLEGVVVGLVLSLAKLVLGFSRMHLHARTRPGTADIDVELSGSATWVKLPKLAAELEGLPAGRRVHLHAGALDYIDHACVDLIAGWEQQYRAAGGETAVPWPELHARYQGAHKRRPAIEGAAPQAA
ncbi:MAG TPA: SulP family inorganic anion transporter, partial [Albitalea sp.]